MSSDNDFDSFSSSSSLSSSSDDGGVKSIYRGAAIAAIIYERQRQKKDLVRMKLGLSSLQKVTAALRMLAYGMAADQCDEYLKIGESTRVSRHGWKFGLHVLEVEKLVGSLDCMYWKWKNCPTGWHDSHMNGKIGAPTLILEAVATHNLWIWHCFFGMAGEAPTCNFVINGHPYTMGYYLFDGIYPKWATLIQTIKHPVNAKQKLFAEAQEAVKKDVERAFGVLQA
ncbi:uncharacterized protein LOC131299732 [Rhododendron vialii]|uniref:uncharacterized protein LOC131299732 n=1 Tax=Rhododendron vialii TaxID=182163 RepID=UPI0026604F96|nr:uncharacterized protein LOC131299732 [Rhododendron vialii]